MSAEAVGAEEGLVEAKTANNRPQYRVDLVVGLETACKVLQELFDVSWSQGVGSVRAGKEGCRERGEREEGLDELWRSEFLSMRILASHWTERSRTYPEGWGNISGSCKMRPA
jgi:hypothetical protein